MRKNWNTEKILSVRKFPKQIKYFIEKIIYGHPLAELFFMVKRQSQKRSLGWGGLGKGLEMWFKSKALGSFLKLHEA